MKPLADLTHYDVLDVEPTADAEEIERAYRLASATYGPDSLAVYSLFVEDEVTVLLARVEAAYRVLSDPEERRAYDEGLGAEAREPAAVERPRDGRSTQTATTVSEIAGFEDLGDDPSASFDGARLRRCRLHRGIGLDRVAEVTKINPTYLRFIEEERFEDLPAPVYVRGFVTAYARCLGMNPEAVVPSYMQHFDAGRSSGGGRRLRGPGS